MAQLVAEPSEIESQIAGEIIADDPKRWDPVFGRAAQENGEDLRVHVHVLVPRYVVEREPGRPEAAELCSDLVLELDAGPSRELIPQPGPRGARREFPLHRRPSG